MTNLLNPIQYIMTILLNPTQTIQILQYQKQPFLPSYSSPSQYKLNNLQNRISYQFKIKKQGMEFGQSNLPVVQGVLVILLAASLVFTTFLFRRGGGNYSVKYQIMKRHRFFRENYWATTAVEFLYKAFFILPFLFLAVLAILKAIQNLRNLATILINGLIIILVLYPSKRQLYFIKGAAVWALVLGSQISTLFIYLTDSKFVYLILSVIFYSANITLFYMALLSIQNTYWEISQGITKFKKEVQEVNNQWVKGSQHIPKIFDGGIYGAFCRGKSYKPYAMLYLLSLAMLGIYAFLVKAMTGSNLGIVGLVSNMIFDVFVKIFNGLESKGRSLTSIFIILVAGRLLSFIFGIKLWLLGYCILYFGIAIFIGWMIIDKHLPLKPPSKQRQIIKRNAFSTPQCVLIVLSIQILIMILVQVYALNSSDQVDYNGVTIPIWQWGLLAVVASWAIVVYMISVRVLRRHQSRIKALVEYYFGLPTITQYHAFLFLSLIIVIALGLYCHLYLKETIILIGCLFIPLIYLCLLALGIAWRKNQYQILADTDQYNKKQQKKRQISLRKVQMLQKNKMKGKKRQMMMSKIKSQMRRTSSGGNFFKNIQNQVKNIGEQIGDQLMKQENQNQMELSMNSNERSNYQLEIKAKQQETQKKQIDAMKVQLKQFQAVKNWRLLEMTGIQAWQCFTPTDKKLIKTIIVFMLLLLGFCLTSIFWAKSKFGFSFSVCLLAFLSLFAYYRSYKTQSDLQIAEYIMIWVAFILAIVYWSVFNAQVIGPVVFGILYALQAIFMLQKLLPKLQNKLPLIFLSIKILLSLIFVLITLGINRNALYVSIFSLIFFIGLMLIIPLYFKMRDGVVSKKVYLPVGGIIIGAVIVLSVIGYVTEILSSFAIFTIVMMMLSIGFLATSAAIAFAKIYQEEDSPSIYCSYGQTHYRFQSAKEVLKSNTNHLVIFSFSMITLVIYAAVTTVFFSSRQWSVCILALFWLLEMFINLRVSMSTYYFIGENHKKGFLSDKIILDAFKKLKNEYMIDEVEGEDSPYYLAQLEKSKQEVQKNPNNETRKKLVADHYHYVKNINEEQKFLFFWIALIKFYLYAKQRENMLQTLTEMRQISEELQQNGIFLYSIQLNLKLEEKYEKACEEIEQLEPVDFIVYEEILEKHRGEEKQKKKMLDQMHKKEDKKDKERDEQLYKQMKNTKVDSKSEIANFKQLITDLGKRTLYTDEEFPPNEKSLGSLEGYVSSWRRPVGGQKLIQAGINADDVKQGMIGDCYLISSLAVLGQKRILQALGEGQGGQKRWVNDKGAYMVRFYKFSKEYYVVIDDQLPINEDKEWVFAKSNDPNQFWPSILEKAYAKLYSGYHNIVEGKCHRVLSEFTGGFPSQIVLDQYSSNPNGLWTQLINAVKNGYLLGAGSPPHADGDKAWSKRGIVYGHAYSVLDAKEAEGYKVIKLKNPHGSGGREWIGDFSDKSELMSKRMMSLLNHKDQDDGIFWMPLDDFIKQFKSLYMCVVFDERWKKFQPITDEWTDENSMGTPNNEGCEKNPHYGITVTKKSNIFISLSQQPISALKGKNAIYLRIQRNQGRRMKKEDIGTDNLVGKPQRPRDAAMISAQLELQADSYPYTFSLMVCCKEPGSTGQYCLEMYCDDPQSEIILNKDFDNTE